MGYQTSFTGALKFKRELISSELDILNKLLGVDTITFVAMAGENIRIQLKLTADLSGIEWDGSETVYHMQEAVNLLINEEGIDLQLEGELLAQGEDYDDRWKLVIQENRAVRIEMPRTGKRIMCPRCYRGFVLEEQNQRKSSK